MSFLENKLFKKSLQKILRYTLLFLGTFSQKVLMYKVMHETPKD
jgi:hypothetical protein